MPPSSSLLSSLRVLSLLSSAAAPSRAAFTLLHRTTTVTRQLQPVRAISSQAVLAPGMAARPAAALQAKTQVTTQQQTRGMKVHSSIKKRCEHCKVPYVPEVGDVAVALELGAGVAPRLLPRRRVADPPRAPDYRPVEGESARALDELFLLVGGARTGWGRGTHVIQAQCRPEAAPQRAAAACRRITSEAGLDGEHMNGSKAGIKRRRAPTNPIERVNRKSDEAFIKQHLRPAVDGSSQAWTRWTHPGTREQYRLSLVRTANLSADDLQACFDLIEETSRKDYEPSSFGWKPSKKLAEMRSPDLRYILVKNAASGLRGFASLMPTYEDGQPVVYCYEIHLKPELRGTGMSRLLMGFLGDVAANSPPITKVMLTCFLSNQHALGFYTKLGFSIDETSPGPRKLRSGKVFVPDYVIMSKTVDRQEAAAAPSLMQEEPGPIQED
ncbi:hypothetical protein DL767_010970 [Monosporascus sp. MG133]|nr:hypothetical protein DL767_010970 [Monosporascus sp. MG133]